MPPTSAGYLDLLTGQTLTLAVSGEDPLSGDVKLVAGVNVMLTQDDVTGEITIAASGGDDGGGSLPIGPGYVYVDGAGTGSVRSYFSGSGTVASAGTVRLASGQSVASRNNANNGDINLIGLHATLDRVQVGNASIDVAFPALASAGVMVLAATGVASSVAPGSSGNVLTSNGTTWVSSAPSGGSGPDFGSSTVETTGLMLAGTFRLQDTSHNGLAKFVAGELDSIPDTGVAIGAVLRIGGAGPAWGQLDLADTDAVTGTLPITNFARGAASTVLTTNSGGAALVWAKLVDANIDPAAAIAGSKVAPAFGAQNISTTGTLGAGATTVTTLTVGTLSGVLKAATGTVSAGLVALTSEVSGLLPLANFANASLARSVLQGAASGASAYTATPTVDTLRIGSVGLIGLHYAGSNILTLGETGWSGGILATVGATATFVVRTGAADSFTLYRTGGNIVRCDVDVAATAVEYRQSPNTTAAATGVVTLLQAQNATGTGATVGGKLALSSGLGATNGIIELQLGGTASVSVLPAPTSMATSEAFEWNAAGVLKLGGFTGVDLVTGSALAVRLSVVDASLKWSTSSGHGEKLCAAFTITFAAGLAIDWVNGRTQLVTMTGNITSITHSNIGAGGIPHLIAVQDATGSRTIAWASTDKFQTASDKLPDSTASSRTEWVGTVVAGDIWWTKLGSWPSGGA